MLFLQKQYLISANAGCGKVSSKIGGNYLATVPGLVTPGRLWKLHILDERLPKGAALDFSGPFHKARKVIRDNLLGNGLFGSAHN